MNDLASAVRQEALAGVSLPVLAEVDRAWATPAGYAADVAVLNRSTLQRTGEALEAVPISPLWAGADGRGMYGPPAAGQLLVVMFVEGDRSAPVGMAVGADPRQGPARAVAADEFALLDGAGGEIRSKGRLWRLATSADSLAAVLNALIDALISATTSGPPSSHVLSPATKSALRNARERLAQVVEE